MTGQEKELGMPVRAARPGWQAVLSLAAFAALAGVVLGLAWDSTRERIADNEARRVLEELSVILPPALHDNEPHRDMIVLDKPGDEPRQIWRARLDGKPAAAVLTSLAPDGYSGQIRLLVAIAVDGRILGVRVASHGETPGIGDVIEARKSPWIRSFDGRSLEDPEESRWRLRKDGGDIDAISGATVSTRAVVAATRRAVQYFRLYREEIFAAPAIRAADAARNRIQDIPAA
jgi:electron transport complex protein RnfG